MSRTLTISLFMTIVLGVGATIWGFIQIFWPSLISLDYIVFAIVGIFTIKLFFKFTKFNTLASGALIALAITIVSGSLWPLIVCVWLIVSSYIVGRSVLSLFMPNNSSLPGPVLILIGSGIYATAVSLSAHFPINYPGVFGTALSIPIIFGWRYLSRDIDKLYNYFSNDIETNKTKYHDMAIAVMALLHFSVVLLPEVGFDALSTHLFVPGHLAYRHEWGFDVKTYVWAVIPMLGDWMYSIGYMIAGETAARLINFSYILLLCWLIRHIVIWAGGSSRGWRWAVLIFLTTPLTYTESNSLFIESIWASFVIAGAYCLMKIAFNPSDASTHLIPGCLLVGFAAASKAITLIILPILFLLMLCCYRRWLNKKTLFPLIYGIGLFILIGGLPYLTAWIISGNPVFPFYNAFFKSPYYPAINFNNPLYNSGMTWDLPYRVVFESSKYLEASNGASGFQWLLLLFPTLMLVGANRNYRSVVLFALGALSIFTTFQSQSYLRYIFPSTILLIAMMGVGLSYRIKSMSIVGKVLPLIASLTVVLNFLFFTSGSWTYHDLPLYVLLSESHKKQYIEKRLPIRQAVELTNHINRANNHVAIFAEPFGAGLRADALYPNWYNYMFQKDIQGVKDSLSLAAILNDYNVEHLILGANWESHEKRQLVRGATEEIAIIKHIELRSVNKDLLFTQELLKNPNLSQVEGWSISSGVKFNPESTTFMVSVKSLASQKVKVRGGRLYRNAVTARCSDTQTEGRVQINWYDEKENFLSSDIDVFACKSHFFKHIQDVKAPKAADTGVVYATSHTDNSIEISAVSLKY